MKPSDFPTGTVKLDKLTPVVFEEAADHLWSSPHKGGVMAQWRPEERREVHSQRHIINVT